MTHDVLTASWPEALRELERQLARPALLAWLRDARPIRQEGHRVVIGVPNPFVRDWVAERLAHHLRSALRRVLERPVDVELVVEGGDEAATAEPELAAMLAGPAGNGGVRPQRWLSQPLNPKYTFDTFVIGNSNRLAHAAALAVAEAPARAYNPLFLYGGVGLGKTHLMQAIAHHVLQRNPSMRVVYVSSETFTNQLIDAIRDGKTADFRNRYRGVDILLVDDIQFLAGKEMTQEEFFHTFNALHEANRQIVLSSDRPPKEIPTLEERLRSRFEWGLISDIQPPDLETRIAILRKKASMEGIEVPEDVVVYIAERVTTNIRELEGALIRLAAYASLHGQPITLDLARETLKDLLPPARRAAITIAQIQQVVAEYYGLSPRDFQLRRRTRAIAFPRQVAMYLCRELTDASLPRIGQEFGGRDHTTVLHACEKIAQQARSDPDLAATLELLRQRIRAGG